MGTRRHQMGTRRHQIRTRRHQMGTRRHRVGTRRHRIRTALRVSSGDLSLKETSRAARRSVWLGPAATSLPRLLSRPCA